MSAVNFVGIKKLPWESKIFGIKCAEIICGSTFHERKNKLGPLLELAIKIGIEAGIKFFSSKTYANDYNSIHALESSNFHLVDTVYDFTYALEHLSENIQTKGAGYKIRDGQKKDRAALKRLFRVAFAKHFGRFNSDTYFSEQQALSFYEAWGEAGAFSEYINYTKLAEINDGTVIGATLWRTPTKNERDCNIGVAHYSIGAVDPEYSGKGIFQALTIAGLLEFKNSNINFVHGPTHVSNYPVQNAYFKMGWKISDVKHTFHLWR